MFDGIGKLMGLQPAEAEVADSGSKGRLKTLLDEVGKVRDVKVRLGGDMQEARDDKKELKPALTMRTSLPHRINRMVKVTLVALLATACAAVVRTVCHSVFNETIPYTPFYPAIVTSTMYGRLPGGLIATVMSAFAASFWLAPFGQLVIQEPTDLIGLFLFLAVSAVVVVLCEAMLRAKHLAERAAAEQRRATDREYEARIEAENANRLKDQFLASASHELRTPLQAILGWTDLLAKTDIDRQDRAEGLGVIKQNALTQARLIEDLLDMSRIVAGKMRLAPRIINPLHVVDAAIQTVTIAAQAKRISIVRCYEEQEPALWADPDRLQQVVWNLLSNSIKFSPSGTSITVTVRAEHHSVRIEVCDQGQGIEADFLPHIFGRFRQADMTNHRRHAGLGLGLSIVKHLVELHGGQIEASSEGVGLGTRIAITFPAVESIIPPRSADARRLPGQELRGVRVLVVDDDAATCDLIARILKERHSEVVAVTSVDRALAAMNGFEPDVIVSDIAMPDRDGYELLRQIRSREGGSTGRVRAMALTALSSAEDQKRILEAGYRLYLRKPVESCALTEAVAELALN